MASNRSVSTSSGVEMQSIKSCFKSRRQYFIDALQLCLQFVSTRMRAAVDVDNGTGVALPQVLDCAGLSPASFARNNYCGNVCGVLVNFWKRAENDEKGFYVSRQLQCGSPCVTRE
jgi:hypothetical protein